MWVGLFCAFDCHCRSLFAEVIVIVGLFCGSDWALVCYEPRFAVRPCIYIGCVCVCVCVYMYIGYIYIYIHTHTSML